MSIRRVRRWEAAALPVLGLWSAAVPRLADSLGLSVPVSVDVEIADHVVPGIVVAAAGLVGWWIGPRAPFWGAALWAGVCFLAGVWMTTTHVPLVGDAVGGEVGWGEATFHSLPGLAVLLVSLAALVRLTADDSPAGSPSPAEQSYKRK